MFRKLGISASRPGPSRRRPTYVRWGALGLGCLCAMTLSSTVIAGEVVPSVGLTRSAEGTQTRASAGLALRGGLAPPFLSTEIGAAYRSDELNGGDVSVHMWPITASLLLSPIPTLYGRAGVGWYHTTYERQDIPQARDITDEQFGTHVGGGMRVPLASVAAVELDGRYVFLQDQEESELLPDRFDPSFWTLSLGLAIGF